MDKWKFDGNIYIHLASIWGHFLCSPLNYRMSRGHFFFRFNVLWQTMFRIWSWTSIKFMEMHSSVLQAFGHFEILLLNSHFSNVTGTLFFNFFKFNVLWQIVFRKRKLETKKVDRNIFLFLYLYKFWIFIRHGDIGF